MEALETEKKLLKEVPRFSSFKSGRLRENPSEEHVVVGSILSVTTGTPLVEPTPVADDEEDPNFNIALARIKSNKNSAMRQLSGNERNRHCMHSW